MSAALSRSQPRASSAPETMPTTLNSSSAGRDSWTCSVSTPGSTARRALTGRLGMKALPQDSRRICGRLLRRLRAAHRTDDEPELGVVGRPLPIRHVFRVDPDDEVAGPGRTKLRRDGKHLHVRPEELHHARRADVDIDGIADPDLRVNRVDAADRERDSALDTRDLRVDGSGVRRSEVDGSELLTGQD